jgi:hypothetical protein
MRRLWRVLGGLADAFGWIVMLAVGMHIGQGYGYGRGARDLSRLIIEMRQGSHEAPEPWTRGDI